MSLPSTRPKDPVVLEAMAGADIRAAVIHAVSVAALLGRSVTLIHNGRLVTVHPTAEDAAMSSWTEQGPEAQS